MMTAYQAGVIMDLARACQAEHRRRLSIPYPPASKRGEYPRRRTGNLHNSIAFRPGSAKAVAVTGSLRMGYMARASYGNELEIDLKRSSLADTISDVLMDTAIGAKARKAGVKWTHVEGYSDRVG